MKNKRKIKAAVFLSICCMFFLKAAVLVSAAGTLSVAVSQASVKTGDTVTVTIYAEGAQGEEVTADLNVTYDAAKLEYVSSSASGASGGGGSVKASGSEVDIRFKAIASGDAYIKAEGAALTSAGTHITVSGTQDAASSESDVAKSGDNSLSSLTISHGTLSPAFKGSVTQYTAEVGSDVNEITVTPVTSNSKATVESVTGNTDLKNGTNVISIVVRAENGNQATYKITVTKGDTGASSSGNAGVSNIAGMAAEQVKGDGEEASDTQTPMESTGEGIEINGVKYRISSEFEDSVIPEGFSKADFEYKGNSYQGIMFDKGYLGMYYLVNDAGEGRFFIYDANRDSFYPYVRLNSGEHFIILMTVPNGVIPPENYEEATLVIGEETVPAYQYAGDEDAEIVKAENEEGELVSGGQSDFYIFYGMDATGVTCWYQYDSLQNTYQRFNEEAISSEGVTEDYEALANSYKELNERQKKTKINDRRLIAILIFVSVVFLIIIINLFLKIRDLKRDGEDEHEMEKDVKPAKNAKAPGRRKTVKKIRAPKKVYKTAEEPKDNGNFYDDDEDDIMDEFEEDPVVLRRKPKKNTKPVRKEPAVSDDDDDLEFLDLDDL